MTSRALEGVIVTELGSRIGASACGSLLAALGATVVVIEPSPGAALTGKWHHRAQFTAGKLSFAPRLDLESDTVLLRQLLARSDAILISSDVDAEVPLPDCGNVGGPVVCDVTAFGATGAMAGQPWSDLQIQALSGIIDTTGMADGPPVPIALPITDFLTATYAAAATVAALRARRLSGVGQAIDMALFDSSFAALNSFLSGVLSGQPGNTSRIGNRHPKVVPWNLYRALDGCVLICAGNQPQWQRLCDVIERPDYAQPQLTLAERMARVAEIDAAIEHWTSRFTVEHCIARLVEAGIACGPIAPVDEYPREANLDYREMIRRAFDPVAKRDVYVSGPPLRMSASPDRGPATIPAVDADRPTVERLAASPRRAAVSSAKPRRPLDGIRLIEIGQYTTAPLCTRHLAHLGAEVIKIEPPEGTDSRYWAPSRQGISMWFRLNNSDKRSITLDLRSPFGARVLGKLIESADVLVENLKPGALTRLGFSPEQIARINPKLVYCAISGFGSDSLYASRPAFDMVIQAMGGFMAAINPGSTPLKSGISTADTMGAEMAILGVLAALEQRDLTGRGQYVDLSMQDVTAWLTQTAWNRTTVPPPLLQRCRDGYVLADAPAEAVTRALATTSSPGTLSALAALTRDEAVSALTAAGIASAPVLSVAESAMLPHTVQRGLHYSMQENGEDWPMLACPMRLLGTPPQITYLARQLNADGATVLAELGLESEAAEAPAIAAS